MNQGTVKMRKMAPCFCGVRLLQRSIGCLLRFLTKNPIFNAY